MFLRRLTLIMIVAFCVNSLSGCNGDKGGAIVGRWHDVQNNICTVLNSIEDEKSAEDAIPKLKELAVEFTQAKNDFLKYQKDNPGFEQKYLQETSRVMFDWGNALMRVNTNQKVPEELRKEILEILSL